MRGGRTLEVSNRNEVRLSEERYFVVFVGSAARHLLLSPLLDRCYAVYQLQSAIQSHFLHGFQQSLATVLLLCSTLHSILLSSCLWLYIVCLGNHHGVGSERANHIPFKE